jgi:hypothetical protein
VLAWNKAEPCRHVPSSSELPTITCSRYDGCCRERSDSWNRH